MWTHDSLTPLWLGTIFPLNVIHAAFTLQDLEVSMMQVIISNYCKTQSNLCIGPVNIFLNFDNESLLAINDFEYVLQII